jgi:hypothetical protein
MVMDGHWLTISEYSNYRQLSVSSIRRYIKSKKVIHKKEEGKYFIFVTNQNLDKKSNYMSSQKKLELLNLNKEIKRLTEENNDMRMLIDIYEKNKKIIRNTYA